MAALATHLLSRLLPSAGPPPSLEAPCHLHRTLPWPRPSSPPLLLRLLFFLRLLSAPLIFLILLSLPACPLVQALWGQGVLFFFLFSVFFSYFLASPCSMWDLSYPPRDRTRAPLHWQPGVLTTGLPGKFWGQGFFKSCSLLLSLVPKTVLSTQRCLRE